MSLEDKLYPFLSLYEKSPQFVRILLGVAFRKIPLRLRYGKIYSYYNKLIKQSAYWSDEKKENYVLEKFKETLINAYENTSYFKNLFDEINLNPHKITHLKEIEKIPFSDKDILRKNKKDLINKIIPKAKLLYMTTGGTSGIPVELYFTKGCERSLEFAFMINQWERMGYKFNHKIAVLRGTVVDDKGNNTFFKFEPIKNRLLLSTYDLYEENYPLYIKKLQEFQPDFIHTYPSAIILLAKYLLKNDIKISSLKGIFCSSEQFYPGQRELIEEAFKTKVYSWYGHTEHTTLAGECEKSNNYHIFFEYGLTELIDENGNVIEEPGKQGEIVGTSFEMKAFPIIRYRTGDYAEYVGEKCSCGRNYTLITNVKGRWLQENILTNKNSNISLTMLNMHSDIFNNVVQYQFFQEEKGKVVLRIIKSNNFSQSDEIKIIKSFKEKFKNLVDFQIKYVDKLERTERGKHKFLIQKIKNE